MKIMTEYEDKVIEISLQPPEVNMVWDLMDKIEDRYYFLGETWNLPRRYRPDKLTFVSESKDDKRTVDINEARHKKKIAFEKKQMEEQRRDEQRAMTEFARKNATRRGSVAETINLTRDMVEKRARGK